MSGHFLQGIDTVIMRVSDIHRSKEWYSEKLGLAPIHEDPIHKLAVMDTFSPTSLTLWQTEEKIQSHEDTCSFPIFRTQDASAAYSKLKEMNVSVAELTTDHVVTYFRIYDPDKNILEVCQVHN
jgi:catechol 2,3-dioxygenase-like lactoylglutathione lyase family enzyme